MTWTWSNNVPQVDKIRQLLSLNWWLTILNFEISGSPWSSVPLDLPPTKLSKPKILKLPFIQGEDAIMAKLYSHFRIAIFVILYVCLFESSNKSRIYLSNIWYLFNYNTFSYDLASRSLDEWIALGYPRCSYLMNGIVLNRPKPLNYCMSFLIFTESLKGAPLKMLKAWFRDWNWPVRSTQASGPTFWLNLEALGTRGSHSHFPARH